MTLLLEQFGKNFGKYPVPQILQDLLEFQNRSQEWYSGSFELDEIGKEALTPHLGENQEVLKQFIGFGHDSNYSIYALWLYQEMPLEDAPVVYLDAEGEGTSILANNLAEFLTLLTWDEESLFGVYSDTDEEIEHTERNQEFRIWIQEHAHFHVPSHPNDVVQKARLNHPDLEEWILRRMAS